MPDGHTAVIETAAAAGLTLIKEHNPWLTSTYGLGQMIADARDKGYDKVIVGLGGSATNDGGTGMLQALGYKFYDRSGKLILSRGGRILSEIASVEAPAEGFGVSVTALCDVDNLAKFSKIIIIALIGFFAAMRKRIASLFGFGRKKDDEDNGTECVETE